MPQLDFSFYKINIVSLLISFSLVYLVVKYVILQSYDKILLQRRAIIDANISAAKAFIRQITEIDARIASALADKKQKNLLELKAFDVATSESNNAYIGECKRRLLAENEAQLAVLLESLKNEHKNSISQIEVLADMICQKIEGGKNLDTRRLQNITSDAGKI